MTIQVGIICKEAIVLASDSLITNHGFNSYEDKISVVNFMADQILIAQSGVSAITKRAISIIQQKANGQRLKAASDVVKIAEEAMREVKDHLADDDQRRHLLENGAALMMAFYARSQPHVYRIDAHLVTAEPASCHYATAGLGSYLADYLLTEFAPTVTSTRIAMAKSIFVIKKVKEIVQGCGGDTTVKIVNPVPVNNWEGGSVCKFGAVNNDLINNLEKRLVKLDEKTKDSRNKQINAILQQEADRSWKKHLKKVQSELNKEQNNMGKTPAKKGVL